MSTFVKGLFAYGKKHAYEFFCQFCDNSYE